MTQTTPLPLPYPPVVAAGLAPDQLGTVVNTDSRVSRDYAEAVFRRSQEPMEPLTFEIDWDDQPSKHQTHAGATRLPLPLPTTVAGTAATLLSRAPGAAGGWDLARLSAMLRLSCGVLDRRLRINWNPDNEKRAGYSTTTWSRGTASGGGMYPVEVYLVSGPSGPLLPGVYHYATGHHELERLAVGDHGHRVAAAVRAPADSYLVAAVRFWKNAFKYNSFCYHVVTQDLGALLGSWDALARAMDVAAGRLLWFDDRAVDAVLGLDTATESAMAVVPVSWAGTSPGDAVHVEPVAAQHRHPARELSTRPLRFPLVDRVHAAALVGDAPRPRPAVAATAAPLPITAQPAVDLPPPPGHRLAADLDSVVRARRSSFGGFTSSPPLGLDELGTLLAAGAVASAAGSDLKPEGEHLTRLFVLAHRVDGLPSGGYAYDHEAHRLHRVLQPRQPLGPLLQQHYLLTNYNTDQAAAVLVISGRLEPMLAGYGNRGYRLLQAEVGAVAQASYLAAAALGVGCGAVLGLDNLAIDDLLGVGPAHGSDERTLLYLFVGPERTDPADFDLRLS